MLKKVLIANRGEIAVRIIRTCRELGISTVAVFSEADRNSLHTHLANESICIGGNSSISSYLNMQNILSAAILTSCQAIHPGFGFLSENAQFAKMCNDCNLVFIGPDSNSMLLFGNKSEARELMKKHGIPCIKGSDGAVTSKEQCLELAKEFGYPVLIKTSLGGGGRGIRVAHTDQELLCAYDQAKEEARICFGDDGIYLEKFLQNTRHIEFQILADNYGNTTHLGERDCSLQRRKQKMIEETPSVAISPRLREEMGEAAIKVARAANYKNAGTVEFLLDQNDNFYFMEMNARIQVEHPITEMVTGVDLVKEQLLIADGEKLSIGIPHINGHSIECRINAENPKENFKPSSGTITELLIPGGLGVRFDSCIYSGYTIPPYYDSMLGKIIVHGKDRQEAIARMKRALLELVILGVDTNIEFHLEILNNPAFLSGNINTSFIDKLN